MAGGRQRDHTIGATSRRARRWRQVFMQVCLRRMEGRLSAATSTHSIATIGSRMMREERERSFHLARRNRISVSQFTFNFNRFSESEALLHFRFKKSDVIKMITAMAWPFGKTGTHRNRFSVTPLLATCIILRRLVSPARWRDLEEFFGKHASQMSEIFWEGMEHLLDARENLIKGSMSQGFIEIRAAGYASAIYEKSHALDNCVGFIDGTVIGIARPKGYEMQRVAYNGHKRKHALKFQALNSPDGLVLHVYGPIEGRRHDWTMYTRSGLNEHLPEILDIDGERYCIYGDSGYNRRWFIEVPYQGSNLTPTQVAFNKAMASVRITVEWIFKELKLYFTSVDCKRKLKVFESPVGSLYLAAIFLSNMRNCVYLNQVSKYFGCPPPTLEHYLGYKQ